MHYIYRQIYNLKEKSSVLIKLVFCFIQTVVQPVLLSPHAADALIISTGCGSEKYF